MTMPKIEEHIGLQLRIGSDDGLFSFEFVTPQGKHRPASQSLRFLLFMHPPLLRRTKSRSSSMQGMWRYADNDGYWDKTHQWHKWNNEKETKVIRETRKEVYHDWKHDRDPDQGWIEEKREERR